MQTNEQFGYATKLSDMNDRRKSIVLFTIITVGGMLVMSTVFPIVIHHEALND